MAGYMERALAAEKALKDMQAAVQPVDRLFAHSVLIEAALNVLMKHKLMDEFSSEVSRLEDLKKEPPSPKDNAVETSQEGNRR